MEGVDLPTLVPGVGVFGLLAWLIVKQALQNAADRREYATRLQEERAQHAKDLADAVASGNARADEQREQIRRRDADIETLRSQLEAERRARWQAEDDAARWRRQVAAGLDDPAG